MFSQGGVLYYDGDNECLPFTLFEQVSIFCSRKIVLSIQLQTLLLLQYMLTPLAGAVSI